MKLLAIRFCTVTKDARELAAFMSEGLGLESTLEDAQQEDGSFMGAVYPTEGGSWVEVWEEGSGMPAGTMLQMVVDDADALAETARSNGLEPMGPTDAHGERIYFIQAPGGLPVSFQSKLNE